MKHFIATISFTANDDVDAKQAVSLGADRMEEYGYCIAIFDTHVEEMDTEQELFITKGVTDAAIPDNP